MLICTMYREFKRWGEEDDVSGKESYKRMQIWQERISPTFEQDQEVWIMGDWNVDYLRNGDESYNRKRILNLIRRKMEGNGFS